MPKWIEKGESKQADMRIVLQGFVLQYNFCVLTYEINNVMQEHTIRLKIPINTLMYCKPFEGGIEEFKAKLEELQNAKMGGALELDRNRINSLTKMKEAISLQGAVKVYPQFDSVNKGRIYAATQLDENVGLIQLDVTPTNPPQCFMTVYCTHEGFRAAVACSVFDMLGRAKPPASA